MKIQLLSDGTFKLDGGAMHGVVPHALWEKQNPTDEKNRILLGLNCLLVDTGREKVLVEPGIGMGHSEKFSSIFCIDKKRTLLSELANLKVSPSEISYVIPTHLHFDHAGGLVDWSNGKLLFPKARIVVQELEWKAAMNPHPKNQASYLPEFLEPLKKATLELINGDKEILPGIRVSLTGGHTHGHQAVFLQGEKNLVAYPGDLIPTAAHVNPLWTMAYDVEPEQSISMKKVLLKQGVLEKWTFVLVHDPRKPVGEVVLDEKERYEFKAHPSEMSSVGTFHPERSEGLSRKSTT